MQKLWAKPSQKIKKKLAKIIIFLINAVIYNNFRFCYIINQ